MGNPRVRLAGGVVLITGGARGIGLASAEHFARRGATVCIGDLDGEAAAEACAAIGPRSHAFQLDVTSRESFAACVDEVLASFGCPDVLVNNAGVMPLGSFLDEPDAISRTTMEVNVWGPLLGMRLVLPHMLERGSGHVVNVVSMAGKVPVPGMTVYNASKFAALGLSLAVREELAGTGVTVSAVLPSAVRTRLSSGVELGHGMPTVEPEEVARAIVGSVSRRAAEITVPGWLAGWDLLDAATPAPVMRLGRRLLGDRRALTGVDAEARYAYEESIARQAG